MAIFKNSLLKLLSILARALKKYLFSLLMISLGISIFGGFWFLSQLGPKNVDFSEIKPRAEVSEAAKAFLQESIALEARYDEVVTLREPSAGDIILLTQAIEKQDNYIRAINGFDSEAFDRKIHLEKRYQEIASKSTYQESLNLEQQAEAFALKKDFENAIISYNKAFEKQQKINENFPHSLAYNVSRAILLKRQIISLTAQPLFQRSLAYEKEAKVLEESKEWAQAEKILKLAIDLQDRINQKYRGIKQADMSRLGKLQAKLIRIKSGESYTELERVLQLADSRRAANENFEAAALYEEAARLQQEINDDYRESPHASSHRVSEFLRNSETAKSLELGLEIERNHDLLQSLLAERRTYEASEIIVALRRGITQMQASFPLSSLNNKDLQIKIRYLTIMQKDLSFIHDRIYDALLPVPESEEWLMLRTEVSQALFSLIMGTNPSRNKGDLRPVDSVNWIDAKNFCERLGWVLGKPVRLPTENEFRLVLGPLRYLILEDHVWSAESANGIPQNIGTKEPFGSDYCDLLGNVSEWLESIDRFGSEEAIHIGGHAQDRLESIFSVPLRYGPRGERSRLIGFRVVVRKN
jgi:tetratricopeptide (TPR) repeat protein